MDILAPPLRATNWANAAGSSGCAKAAKFSLKKPSLSRKGSPESG
jgi:hypothetical protein